MTTYSAPHYRLISSSEDHAMWSHPILDLYPESHAQPALAPRPIQKAKLYLVPSHCDVNYGGDDCDADDCPIPTSATELPELHAWTMTFAVALLEIWAGRRQPAQLMARCHRVIYNELIRKTGSQKEIGKIRTIHQSEPLDGICESTITVRFGERLRAITIRFEGVDGRWLCTELDLI
ncbi:unannotated protein [freshwater metagenome]|uniref:Unannotated protein n=1 Tax=freshwater metagenome TaxID=449393 RepID=A0A6J6KWC3_9ZZZZ|nr:hypothetical protein [Actinomycetota bacterium]